MSPLELWLPARAARAADDRSEPPTSGLSSRVEVCPPQLWPSSMTVWGRMERWLTRNNPLQRLPGRSVNRLRLVKGEFHLSMHGLQGEEADLLARRIECARSLRELWHLRCMLYGQLSIFFSQSEAQARLARLNRHFPTRAPRSAGTPGQA